MPVPLESSVGLNISMLPEGQLHTDHHLGGAKDPHPVRLFNEPHPDPTGALGATTHSRECSLGTRNSMSPSPTVIVAKASMSLLFHTALFSSCSCAARKAC